MKTISSEHVVYKNCFECQNKNKKQFLYTTCSELVFSCTVINEHSSSYYGLTDSRMSASDTDLPVLTIFN